jgi:thiamine biosynthesis protein ThiS
MTTDTIEITINGFKETVQKNTTIRSLIFSAKEQDRHLIVEHNGRFVYPRDYDKIKTAAGDRIEIIHPNFGG